MSRLRHIKEYDDEDLDVLISDLEGLGFMGKYVAVLVIPSCVVPDTESGVKDPEVVNVEIARIPFEASRSDIKRGPVLEEMLLNKLKKGDFTQDMSLLKKLGLRTHIRTSSFDLKTMMWEGTNSIGEFLKDLSNHLFYEYQMTVGDKFTTREADEAQKWWEEQEAENPGRIRPKLIIEAHK